MRGLRKYLTPFAPDQSGAVSVLYELGGLIVVCDAGGCTGNICGFDEPRWQNAHSAVFSAGLRDMDAILGRDELLVSKIVSAAKRIDATFVAIIGTPVPATIATDYKALKRMLQKQISLPIITVEANGMRLYDRGEMMAYKALIEEFKDSTKPESQSSRKNLVLGATPLTYGDDYVHLTLDDFKGVGSDCKVVAASASGIETCKACKLDYEVRSDKAEALLNSGIKLHGKVLVVHDAAFGITVRNSYEGSCDVASFFAGEDIIRLEEEDDFTELVNKGGYDMIIADNCLRAMVPAWQGEWVDAPYFAISGRKA